jgi:hypothetical protein
MGRTKSASNGRRLSDETERHPLFALTVAVGVGILIGMVSRHWD